MQLSGLTMKRLDEMTDEHLTSLEELLGARSVCRERMLLYGEYVEAWFMVANPPKCNRNSLSHHVTRGFARKVTRRFDCVCVGFLPMLRSVAHRVHRLGIP